MIECWREQYQSVFLCSTSCNNVVVVLFSCTFHLHAADSIPPCLGDKVKVYN